jgi:drug/metabolite transporter (DMT)-like permease
MSADAKTAPTDAWGTLVLWGLQILFDTTTQLTFKRGAEDLAGLDFGTGWLVAALLSPWVLTGIAAYLGNFVVWMLILRRTPLSRAFPLTGLAYVTVPLAAWAWLGDRPSLPCVIGTLIIIAGVMLLGWDDS